MRWRLSNPQLCHPRVLKQQQHHHQEYFMSKKSCPFYIETHFIKRKRLLDILYVFFEECIMPFIPYNIKQRVIYY